MSTFATGRRTSPKTKCPVCKRLRAINSDGTIRAHAELNAGTVYGAKRWCAGSWRKPLPDYVYVRWLMVPKEVFRAAYADAAESWASIPPVVRVPGSGPNDVYQPVPREFAERWHLPTIGENTLREARRRER